MVAKILFAVCVQALIIQFTLGQYANAPFDAPGGFGPCAMSGRSWALDGAYDGLPGGLPGRSWVCDGPISDGVWSARGLPCGFPTMDFTPTAGGALPVTSASAIPPTGISILSENVFDGVLAVTGEIPFVGTTGMDGIIPTLGAGAINYGCGNGVTAMVSETAAPMGAFGPGVAYSPAAFGTTAGLSAATAFTPAGLSTPAGGPAAAFTPAGFGPSLGFGPSRSTFGPCGSFNLY